MLALLHSEVDSLAAAGCWRQIPAEDDKGQERRASIGRVAPEEEMEIGTTFTQDWKHTTTHIKRDT